MKICPYCATELTEEIYRDTVCPNCKKPLHTCICCLFYDVNAHWHCREDVDELVKYVDEENFCEQFKLTNKSLTQDKNKKDIKAFESLFG